MNSSRNYFYSSNRNYRHCIKTDVEQKIINDRPYQTPSQKEYNHSRQHTDNHSQQLNVDKLNSYEKLLNNLSSLSEVVNNFFNVLQGILGTSVDTLFTDYSFTNVIEIDKRLQTILKILMTQFQM